MPIIVLLDNSFSMQQKIPTSSANNQCEPLTRMKLAIHGLNFFFEFLKANKLESTALLSFSRDSKLLSSFTRDYEFLKNCLIDIDFADKSNLLKALNSCCEILKVTSVDVFYHIVIFTDGNSLLQSCSLNKNTHLFNEKELSEFENLNFPHVYKVHVVCLTTINDPALQKSLSLYKNIISKTSSSFEINTEYEKGQVWVPDNITLSTRVVEELIFKIFVSHFRTYAGKIACGNLTGFVGLYPNLKYDKFTSKIKENLDIIQICGFLNCDEIANPPVYSRHYVIPLAETNVHEMKKWISFLNIKSDLSDQDIINLFSDESKQPSFAVLIHGSLKIANMVALCRIGSSHQWYGILHSVNNKNRSSLMLYTFEPGLDSVPWISNFHNFSLSEKLATTDKVIINKKFSNYYVWLHQQSIQNDVQKILRFARKLPEKFDQLCFEVNRIRRTTLAFDFTQLIKTIVQLLERERNVNELSNNSEIVNQLNQIIQQLKQPINKLNF